ncbi:MAG TPA: hypothetical protein VG032_08640 [Acidimicrobiales bacterium]|jgi:hypothetical protein|nr:hypothetical protein [Acidimicrobiales bacterium]
MAFEPAGFSDSLAPQPAAPVLTRAERRRRAKGHPSVAAIPWTVAAATLVLRLVTAATGPTDWDSAQYASAVGHYDVTHGQPQPPGYWLYVFSGRLVHAVTGAGTVRSLVLVTALASAAAAGLTALAGKDLGGWWVGLAAGAIVATSPFAWFAGSAVGTYSFDMLGCAGLMVLAWRARPGSWHGVAAAVVLALVAGFRQSAFESFAVLALIAVIGSIIGSSRRWSRLVVTVLAGAAAVGVWLVPMAVEQPGGLSAWAGATRHEAAGAAQLTSVLDHATGGATNVGTFLAYTVVALAPLALLAAIGLIGLLFRRLAAGPSPRSDRPAGIPVLPRWTRPWYQGRTAILAAAIVPPVLIVSLVQFAKGGYLLAYLPAATIALLLPLGALGRHGAPHRRTSPAWMVVTSLAVAAVVVLGAQRFLVGGGVLPEQWVRSAGPVWLVQPRYQAPFLDTRATIESADDIDAALGGLAPLLRTNRDVVVFDMPDGGANIYRNAGWVLPDARIALIAPGAVVYNELHGVLYYATGRTVPAGPGGSVLLVASPALPGLARATAEGHAVPVTTPRPIGGYRVWRVQPGQNLIGVDIVQSPGPRPLGAGL